MQNTTNSNIRQQPCMRDCPDRKAGCAISCPKWAEYIKKREAEYSRRLDIKRIGEAIRDGYDRIGNIKRPPRY